ncbi:MAG: 30S ribosomal protein S1 [Candidatus Eisenbacteria bacterium]
MTGSEKTPREGTSREWTPSFEERGKKIPWNAKIKPIAREDEDDVEIPQDILDMYEESFKELREGETIKGRIVKVAAAEVLVDVGFKSEGIIPLSEFGESPTIRVGDQVDVYLEKMENQDGLVVLSKQRADFLRVWGTIKDAYDNQKVVEGKLLKRIQGGAVVDLFGVEAFLPGSQVGIRHIQNLTELIGAIISVKVIKLNKRRRNVVVSRRMVLEEERERQKNALLAELKKGEIREGIVKNITDFGAFIDLGGIDGLLHITDLAWGRVSHPSEMLAIGDKTKVMVLDFELERERISLGLKQLTPYPWEDIETKYPVASKIRGKVVSITDYGAFIELEKGVEGLIHKSEMSWTKHVKHPSKVVAIGDMIEAVVLKIDKENEKISLGLKQVEPDPWETLEERYPEGTRVVGKVRNLTNFGAFVEIEEGIEGLVHISDMSWTKRIRHPSEIVKKGDKVDVVILSINKESRKISLGLKQIDANPWESLLEKYGVGAMAKGKIVKTQDRGVIVELEEDVEGFVPLSHLGPDNIKKPSDIFDVGDEIPLKVIRIDPDARKILLSVKDYLADQDRDEVDEYMRKYGPRKLTVGDVVTAAAVGQVEGAVEEQVEAEADDYDFDDESEVADEVTTEPSGHEARSEVSEEARSEVSEEAGSEVSEEAEPESVESDADTEETLSERETGGDTDPETPKE